ncbi:Bug family tripartite tricarboxylate transporter substrate binding protein [Roseomonas rosulenta]|uniref:Bug family tripartite tricarboxylate transporter substrate binding protein n=1 Tax=Roseomonas rosulenta TaxID=2748667 RepID=UPI0018E06086|nr:tripartite tricarboxylate transporter substrate-binding protein [Roseomonas rosulenta]
MVVVERQDLDPEVAGQGRQHREPDPRRAVIGQHAGGARIDLGAIAQAPGEGDGPLIEIWFQDAARVGEKGILRCNLDGRSSEVRHRSNPDEGETRMAVSRARATRRAMLGLGGAAVLGAPVASADTDRFPTRPVRLVVPFPPGGQTDIAARLLARRLGIVWGVAVVVENRAGANGLLGAEAALRAPPDGHTLLTITSTHAINATLVADAPYDFRADAATLTLLGALPLVAVVPAGSPAVTLADLAQLAQQRPLNGGSSGSGTPAHLALELFRREVPGAVGLQHVPYRGGAPAITDLLGARIDFMFANLPDALAQVQGGRLRALAVTGPARHRLLPSIPAVSEAGFPAIEIGSWTALVAATAVPAALRSRIAEAAAAAMADPETAGRAAEAGFDVLGWEEPRSVAFVAAETERWGRLVREAEIRAES